MLNAKLHLYIRMTPELECLETQLAKHVGGLEEICRLLSSDNVMKALNAGFQSSFEGTLELFLTIK